jgi:hypothetical protein
VITFGQSNAGDEESIVALIHSLAYRLFSDEGNAVSRALILLSRLKEGGWYPVGFITNMIASLVYSVRSTMLYHLYVLAKTDLKLIDARNKICDTQFFPVHWRLGRTRSGMIVQLEGLWM